MSLGNVAGPDSGGQSIFCGVGTTNDFIDILELENAQDWSKDFVGCHGHGVFDVGKNRGLNEIAFIAEPLSTGDAFGTLIAAAVDIGHDLVELGLIDLWTLFRCGIERITKPAGFRLVSKSADKFIVSLLLNEQAAASATTLALIQVKAKHGTIDGGVHISIVKNDVGAFPTKFECESLQRWCCVGHDDFGGSAFTCKGDFVHAPVLDQSITSGFTESIHDIDDTIREAGFHGQFAHFQGC